MKEVEEVEEVSQVVEEVDERIIKMGPEILKDLAIFEAVTKYKSVARAIRRDSVTKYGTIIPKRPFNNRANTSNRKSIHSRVMNEYKKEIYGKLKNTTGRL